MRLDEKSAELRLCNYAGLSRILRMNMILCMNITVTSILLFVLAALPHISSANDKGIIIKVDVIDSKMSGNPIRAF